MDLSASSKNFAVYFAGDDKLITRAAKSKLTFSNLLKDKNYFTATETPSSPRVTKEKEIPFMS